MWYHLNVESKIWHKWTYLWNRLTEKRLVVAKGKEGGEEMDEECGINRGKLLYIDG